MLRRIALSLLLSGFGCGRDATGVRGASGEAAGALPAPPTAYTQEPLRYEDRPGHVMLRWVLSEPRLGGWQRLVVVELPEDPAEQAGLLQRSIASERFAPEQAAAFQARKSDYERFADLAEDHSAGAPAFVAVADVPGDSIARQDNGAVWVATRDWTLDDEAAFGAWLDEHVDTDFLNGTNVAVDCADAAVLFRWIYAHDHGLPAGNTLSGSGRLVGNWTVASAWSQLATNADWKQDERFLAAFRYVQDSLFTHSLLGDLYPVELTRDFVAPGTVHLSLRTTSGHTQTITHVAPAGSDNCASAGGCVTTIWGNEPAAPSLWHMEIVELYGLAEGKGGFMRARWPVKKNGSFVLKRGADMPGYSKQQYEYADVPFGVYDSVIYDLLQIVVSPNDRALSAARVVMGLLNQRRHVAALGYVNCALVPCPATSPEYDQYSTPTRDGRIKQWAQTYRDRAAEADAGALDSLLWSLRQPIVSGLDATYEDYLLNRDGILERWSSDPTADYAARWGVMPHDADAVLAMQVHAWGMAWRERFYKVVAAQQACFPADGTPACSHTSAKIKALATDRLDAGIRALASLIQGASRQATPAGYQQTIEPLFQSEVYFGCAWKQDNSCVVTDYLFPDPEHDVLAAMSSKPWDPEPLRYGVTQ